MLPSHLLVVRPKDNYTQRQIQRQRNTQRFILLTKDKDTHKDKDKRKPPIGSEFSASAASDWAGSILCTSWFRLQGRVNQSRVNQSRVNQGMVDHFLMSLSLLTSHLPWEWVGDLNSQSLGRWPEFHPICTFCFIESQSFFDGGYI